MSSCSYRLRRIPATDRVDFELAKAAQTPQFPGQERGWDMSTRKRSKLNVIQLGAVARLFAVLSECSRLALLQELRAGPLTVNELAAACGLKQANVSKQLAILRDHHLVKRERDGTSICYEIADPLVFSLCDLVCGKMKQDALRAVEVFQPEE